jgi:hypothetical protein
MHALGTMLKSLEMLAILSNTAQRTVLDNYRARVEKLQRAVLRGSRLAASQRQLSALMILGKSQDGKY